MVNKILFFLSSLYEDGKVLEFCKKLEVVFNIYMRGEI